MELEHRSPKSRYLRTSRKGFETQLGSIERRLARIRRIRQKLSSSSHVTLAHEKGPESSSCDYYIGSHRTIHLILECLLQISAMTLLSRYHFFFIIYN